MLKCSCLVVRRTDSGCQKAGMFTDCALVMQMTQLLQPLLSKQFTIQKTEYGLGQHYPVLPYVLRPSLWLTLENFIVLLQYFCIILKILD